MRPIHLCAALLTFGLTMPAVAAPPSWTVDKAKSKVTFTGTHIGASFNGVFNEFAAVIAFDPADLPNSSAKVTFQTKSVETGDSTKDSALAEEDWLNPGKFPTATFATSQITSNGANSYIAKGTLTLKGKNLPATLPFTLTISGNSATMKGTTTVNRLDYEIGTQADGSGTFVSKDIAISVELVATR
jgi:polyisoprenoid-binding protein YceI